MEYSKNAIKNSSIVFLFGVVSTIIGYLTRIFLSHNLTVADFGLFYSVLAIIGIISIFKDLGINTAIAKYIPELA